MFIILSYFCILVCNTECLQSYVCLPLDHIWRRVCPGNTKCDPWGQWIIHLYADQPSMGSYPWIPDLLLMTRTYPAIPQTGYQHNTSTSYICWSNNFWSVRSNEEELIRHSKYEWLQMNDSLLTTEFQNCATDCCGKTRTKKVFNEYKFSCSFPT